MAYVLMWNHKLIRVDMGNRFKLNIFRNKHVSIWVFWVLFSEKLLKDFSPTAGVEDDIPARLQKKQRVRINKGLTLSGD